jgi:hypothetical protein
MSSLKCSQKTSWNCFYNHSSTTNLLANYGIQQPIVLAPGRRRRRETHGYNKVTVAQIEDS